MTDEQLLHIYMLGFIHELNDTYSEIEYEGLELKAYVLGSNHAYLGDDVKSVDRLSDEEILKRIRN